MKNIYKYGCFFIVSLIILLISCGTNTTTYKYPSYEIKGETDFGNVYMDTSKEEEFTIETGKVEKTTSSGPYSAGIHIKSIEIDDTINYSIDTSDTDFSLKDNDETTFKVIFTPRTFGLKIKAEIKIKFKKDSDASGSLKEWEKDVEGTGLWWPH